jgi:TetR/AcrR family transcriptional regulator, transcriptional repressor for nem operon
MRVSRQQAAENRQRILIEASRLFRERGLSGVGVDALTQAAGLSHGSLYSQFGSKDRLAAEAFDHAVSRSSATLRDAGTLEDFVARYLSRDHRNRRGEGCAMAALVGDMPRQGASIRHGFTDAVRAFARRVATLMPARRKPEDEALAAVATMVGALALARAVDDAKLSDRILAAARRSLASRRQGPAQLRGGRL